MSARPPSPRLPCLLLALALLLPRMVGAVPLLLYDPALGSSPQSQPWLTYLLDPFAGTPDLAADSTGTRLDTTGGLAQTAGFFNHVYVPFLGWFLKNPDFPASDPTTGFRLGFELWLHQESHVSPHRAGFSVLLLGQDQRGIELGFWTDRVWAQSGADFRQAEGADLDPAQAPIQFELDIVGLDYLLRADGLALLTGPTRDYSSAAVFPNPYATPNMLFLGDNSSSAAAAFTLGPIWLTQGPFPVAAPAVWLLWLAALPWYAVRRARGWHRAPGRPNHDPTALGPASPSDPTSHSEVKLLFSIVFSARIRKPLR